MKVITITIPAGVISADLPFYLLYVDLSKLPADLFVSTRADGGDIRAVDAADKTLPFWTNRFSKTTKTGAMVIRTPVKAASATVIKITYDVPDRGKLPVNDDNGQYACFAGFRAFYHRNSLRGGSLGTVIMENAVDGSDASIVGTINDGDGTPDSFTFAGNGYLRQDLSPLSVYTLGVVGKRNPGTTGDRTLFEYGDRMQITSEGKIAAFVADDGYLEGPAYEAGAPLSFGLRRNGTTDRTLYAGGTGYPQLAPSPVTPAQATVGAAQGGGQRLTGAVVYAFVYNGLLPADWFKLDYWNNVDDTVTTPPKPPVDPPTNEDDPKMTILFVGTSSADVIPISGTPVADNIRMSQFVKESFYLTNYVDNCYCEFSVAVAEFFASYTCWYAGAANLTGAPYLIAARNAAGQATHRFWVKSGTEIQAQIWNGSSWINVGAPFNPPPSSVVQNYHVRVKLDAVAGRMTMRYGTAIVFDFTGKTDYGQGLIASMGLSAIASQPSWFSGIVCADVDTLGYTVHHSLPTANGALTAWDGVFSDVNEIGYNDNNGISTGTVGAEETFVFSPVSTLYQYYAVEAVVLRFRGAIGTNPDKIKGIARIGTTTYDKDTVKPVIAALSSSTVIFDKNPATGNAWLLTTDFASTQFGFKAAN